MKTLIISTPAMGKTTLVKKSRTSSWANSHGVDFDLKGHNNHSTATRVSSTSLVNDLFAQGHTFVTGFNGSFDFKLLREPTHIVFIAPVTSEAMQAAVIRSHLRGDSDAFNQSLTDNISSWTYGLYSAYLTAKAQLPTLDGCRHKVKFIGITDAHTVIADLFTFDSDTGELMLLDDNQLSSNGIKVTDSFSQYDYCVESYAELVARRIRSFSSRSERELLTRHLDAVYDAHLYSHYLGLDRVNVCWNADESELLEDFQNHLHDLFFDEDVNRSSIKASLDLEEHSCARARITYEYQPRIDPDVREEDELGGTALFAEPVIRTYLFYAF